MHMIFHVLVECKVLWAGVRLMCNMSGYINVYLVITTKSVLSSTG